MVIPEQLERARGAYFGSWRWFTPLCIIEILLSVVICIWTNKLLFTIFIFTTTLFLIGQLRIRQLKDKYQHLVAQTEWRLQAEILKAERESKE